MRSLLRRATCAAFFVLAVSFVLPRTAGAAEWCGTVGADDRPAALGGNPVRVIYAIPSDGQDGSAAAAPRISAGVDQIDAWWRANDSARTPRFDLFPFPCGLQADVTLRRLALSSTDLLASHTRFGRIAAEVRGSGVAASQTKYLVYYDGPVDERRL